MINLLKAEFYKLKRDKVFYILVGLMILESILCPIIFSKNMTGKKVLTTVLGAHEFLDFIILAGIYAGSCIAYEFKVGFIKENISYGHKRMDVVIAKSFVYYFAITIISLISPILITIINTVMNGYGETFTMDSLIFIFRVIVLMELIYISMSSIAVFIAFVSRNYIITMVSLYILDTVNKFGTAFSIRYDAVNMIYSKTVFSQFNIAIAKQINLSQILQVIAICLITILVTTLMSIYIFKKVDIK